MHDTSLTISSTPLEPGSLPTLRRRLVAERAQLRVLQEQLRVARAGAQQECIDAHGGDPKALGATQQDRERALILFLEANAVYQQLSGRLAHQERTVERLQAEIEAARDVRREVEGERLDRYIAALTALAGTPVVWTAARADGA